MPIYTPPYSVKEFNTFYSRSDALQAVRNADPHIHIHLKDLLNHYNLQELFGIALVYKHYVLEPQQALFWNEFPVAYNIEDAEIRDIELNGQALKGTTHTVRPAAWAIRSANRLMPYQFIQVANQNGYAVDPRRVQYREFMHDFMRAVDWADLTPYIGLKLLSITDTHDLVNLHTHNDYRIYPFYGYRAPRTRTPSPSRSRPRRGSNAEEQRPGSGNSGRDVGPEQEQGGNSVPDTQDQENIVRYSSSESRPDTTEETAALSRLSTEPEERLGTPTEDAADERRRSKEDPDGERYPEMAQEQIAEVRRRMAESEARKANEPSSAGK